MNNPVVYYLISKFSQSSIRFFDLYNKLGLNFLRPIDIDARESRILLQRAGIRYLPCIIVEYENNEIEIFEAEKAHTWLDNVANSMKPSNKPIPIQPIQEEVPRNMSRIKQKRSQKRTDISSLTFDDDKEEDTSGMGGGRQKLIKKNSKSLVDIAKQMASSREEADKPLFQRKAFEEKNRKTEAISREEDMTANNQRNRSLPQTVDNAKKHIDVGKLDEGELNVTGYGDESETDDE